MAPWQWYRKNIMLAYGSGSSGGAPNMDYLSDDIRHMLLTASYTPDLDAHDFLDDVVANEASGTGYTAGGFAIATKTLATTAANSLATTWAGSTAFGGDTTAHYVRPTTGNGYVYRAAVAGTSSASEPTWPTTVGLTVTDGGVTWTNAGRALMQFGCANESRTGLTISYRYSLLYNRTPASDATRPLLALYDWGSTQTITAGTVAVNMNPSGLLTISLA